jgi:hypothetical protein
MFEYISNTYLIGNHDTPGLMATYGDNLYYKNWEKFTNYDSFDVIFHQFLKKLENGTKEPLSTRVFSQFFTVNLLNTEYFINCPLRAFIVWNGFLASLLLPLLYYDTFVKPIIGKGP